MRVLDYLRKTGIAFRIQGHAETFDAQHLAQSLHIPGRMVAKTVLIRANGDYVHYVAVLPATHRINVDRLSDALNGAHVELASEVEIAAQCPDCEFGVLPPFGSLYGIKTIVDESLSAADEIVFAGETHHDVLRMKYSDYYRVENPLVALFAEPEHAAVAAR